jgi:hypothetical protein
MSLSLILIHERGPPTWPAYGSNALVIELAAEDSVYPYPSRIGAQKHIFKKFITSAEIGADPVIISFTLPPIKFLILLKISGSHKEWV